jgi:hypothetical protein
MKRLILILMVMAIASSAFAWGNGWRSYGTSGNPLLEAYYTTIYGTNFLPLVANTGSVGAVGNAFNAGYFDTTNTGLLKGVLGKVSMLTTDTLSGAIKIIAAKFKSTAGPDSFGSIACGGIRSSGNVYGSGNLTAFYNDNANAYVAFGGINSRTTIAWYDSTKGFNCDSLNIRSKLPGATIRIDSVKGNHLFAAKDTCLEVALFTRTCVRDTLAFMTGADSLTASYIVSPFATRGAPSIMPYIAGVVGGKLVVDRPEADTADYDRYSVTKIKQR